jgi:hypothetical protein
MGIYASAMHNWYCSLKGSPSRKAPKNPDGMWINSGE